jgi:hypothetical protein
VSVAWGVFVLVVVDSALALWLNRRSQLRADVQFGRLVLVVREAEASGRVDALVAQSAPPTPDEPPRLSVVR